MKEKSKFRISNVEYRKPKEGKDPSLHDSEFVVIVFAERFGSRTGASFGARQSQAERTPNDERVFRTT
jgi:hypothetical protein